MSVSTGVIPENPQRLARPQLVLDAPLAPPSDTVHGIPIALPDYDRALLFIDEAVAAGERGYVCVSNVHTVMAAQEDEELRHALEVSTFNVPDGMPLVWALNLLGHSLDDRVYGPELMGPAPAHAAAGGPRFSLYGGRD